MTTLNEIPASMIALVIDKLIAAANACAQCGVAHQPREVRPGYAPHWADPDDGHSYRPTQGRHVTAWLQARRVEGCWPMAEPDSAELTLTLPAAAVKALYAVYDTWMNKIGPEDPCRELVDRGYGSLLTIEDSHLMEAATDAFEPYYALVQQALEAPDG